MTHEATSVKVKCEHRGVVKSYLRCCTCDHYVEQCQSCLATRFGGNGNWNDDHDYEGLVEKPDPTPPPAKASDHIPDAGKMVQQSQGNHSEIPNSSQSQAGEGAFDAKKFLDERNPAPINLKSVSNWIVLATADAYRAGAAAEREKLRWKVYGEVHSLLRDHGCDKAITSVVDDFAARLLGETP